MTDPIADLVDKFNPLVHEMEILLSIARDSDLQRGGVVKLSHGLNGLDEAKQAAVEAGDENRANAILGFECIYASLRSELMMWLFLKREEPEKAWDCLIEAQDAAEASIRAHHGFSHNSHHVERLEAIERLVFPPQQFVSSGLMVKRQTCSICGIDYDECEHLAARPYMGKFCSIIIGDIAANHVALVESPADKRCRITDFDVPDGTRNRMTWKIEPRADNVADDPRGQRMNVRLMYASDSGVDPREVLLPPPSVPNTKTP